MNEHPLTDARCDEIARKWAPRTKPWAGLRNMLREAYDQAEGVAYLALLNEAREVLTTHFKEEK